MIDLKGHSALITGSTQGVGRAVAVAFARAGCDLIIHGREPELEGESTYSMCKELGVEVHYIPADLTLPVGEIVPVVFERANALLPHVDILVNNAGQFFDLPFLEMTPALFEKTMRLNVESGYFLTQAFARHWVEKKVKGRVLFTGSINGRLAEEGSTAYDTSKGAVEMMVKTLAVALAPKGIRVNGMAPGLVRTATTAWLESRPEQEKWMRYHTPNHQVPGAEVCGEACVYLCSDAAWHVHGQMLLVDGGMSAWQQPRPMPVDWK
ncbi:MAG TPA: SDR family oxidoreductase [Tepidisphaeraceae bacterium]|jgi:NAD(P)-dependent dehydrogenase (short-subunit alcohol dehydrogenase family)|nr:SDR family oxidoreductase [Tepidisphaeraceae bacterium]